MTKKKTLIISVFGGILGGAGIFGAVTAGMLFHKLSPKETAYVYIDSDDNIDSVTTKLEAMNADVSMTAFRWLAENRGYASNIRAGRYEVSDGLTTLQLFRNLRNHSSVPVALTVPSVRTLGQMAKKLSEGLMTDSAAIMQCLTDGAYIESLGYTAETLPALFIPDTYQVFWETAPEALIERMQKENKRFWNEAREAKAKELGMSHEEVATLASIVDSETANNGEKACIAGLYINRLNKHIPLQSDPTVIFAVGDFSIRRVLNQHLAVESPYNTYRVQGLPPGPIRIPSVAGLDAVLNHEHHDYLYMCAKEDFSGTHNYAVSYAEHMKNARRYINALNQRGIRK